jgi:hypothetical protein
LFGCYRTLVGYIVKHHPDFSFSLILDWGDYAGIHEYPVSIIFQGNVAFRKMLAISLEFDDQLEPERAVRLSYVRV